MNTKTISSDRPTRQLWLGKPIDSRLDRLSRLFVEHGAVKELIQHIEIQLLIEKPAKSALERS